MEGIKFRDVLTFTLGAVIGSLVTKHLLKDKYEKEKEESIEEFRELELRRRKKREERKKEMNTYQNLTSQYRPDPAETEHPEEDEEEDCELISFDDFTNSMPHYDKISLTYYEESRVLMDENDEPIDDIFYTIGCDALKNFGYENDDPDVVYVRNNKMGTDFEIVRSYERYDPGAYRDV